MNRPSFFMGFVTHFAQSQNIRQTEFRYITIRGRFPRLCVPLQGKFEFSFLIVFGFVALADESLVALLCCFNPYGIYIVEARTEKLGL